MQIALSLLEVVALAVLGFMARAGCGIIRDTLHEVTDKLLDKSPELDVEQFLQRFVELEGRVELLPSIWDEHYAKTRRAEERIRKANQRARDVDPELEDGGSEAGQGPQGVLPLPGSGPAPDALPEEDGAPARDPDDELRMAVFQRRFQG